MKKILSTLIVFVLCFGQMGCSGSEIDTVLADLPIAAEIAMSMVGIVSAGAPQHVQEVTEYAGKVSADLKLLESLIGQYKDLVGKQPRAAAVPAGAAAVPAGVPAGVLAQMNAALNDAQANVTAILNTVGVGDPKVTAAVAAAVGSVKLILNDAALLIQANALPAVTAQLFFGVGMPKPDFIMSRTQPGAAVPHNTRGSGKSARQIAKEFNQKISKDFPKAKVNVPKVHVLGVSVPMTGGK